jgi:hypothetical protein
MNPHLTFLFRNSLCAKVRVQLARFGICWLLIAAMLGCSTTHFEEQRARREEMLVNMVPLVAQGDSTERKGFDRTALGIRSEKGSLFIKTKGKSFVSVLDEAARIRRFNYTLLTDISKYYIDYFDISDDVLTKIKLYPGLEDETLWTKEIGAQEFRSIDDFVQFSVSEIRKAYSRSDFREVREMAANLAYGWSGDGFVFYDVRTHGARPSQSQGVAARPPGDSFTAPGPGAEGRLLGFKKIFLYNLSEREVAFYLTRLFDIPYSPFSPSKSADLPRRLESGQQAAQPMVTNQEDWKLNGQSNASNMGTAANRDISQNGGFDNVRWITLPQQNAIVIRGFSDQLDDIGRVLHSLDSEYKQIILEARIFEYNSTVNRRIGLALGNVNGSLEIKATNGGGSFSLTQAFGAEVANALPGNFYFLPALERRFALLSALALYGRDGTVRISAEPRLLLKPGQVSTMDITNTKTLQPSAQFANNGSILPQAQKVEAGVFFTVKPTLLSDNKVQLDLFLKQSEFTSSNEKSVLVSTSENQLTTSIVATHGELISLGGMESKKFSSDNAGIPGLKDSGVIGHAFGQTDEGSSTVRVEFMLRPFIRDVEEIQRTQIRNLIQFNEKINSLIRKEKANPVPKVIELQEIIK